MSAGLTRGLSLADRIRALSKVTEDGCWQWQARLQPNGYGRITLKGRRVALAHRAAYEAFVGAIPAGLQIDHACGNRACVNPAHLGPATGRENKLRAPRNLAAVNAAKTHCPQGHPYDEVNTAHRQGRHGVQRVCRACVANRRRRAAA